MLWLYDVLSVSLSTKTHHDKLLWFVLKILNIVIVL